MKYTTLLLILLLPVLLLGQTSSDVGLFIGATQYWGDLNPRKIIYSPDIGGGIVYRYNINKRYSLRFNGVYSHLNVDAVDEIAEATSYDQQMHTNLLNFALQGEFNFLPVRPDSRYDKGALFLAAGAGYTLNWGDGDFGKHFCVPFGVGYKHYLTERIGITGELSFRKTFTDALDNVSYDSETTIQQTPQNTLLNNNDWYTFAGISITYRFYNSRTSCPVYD